MKALIAAIPGALGHNIGVALRNRGWKTTSIYSLKTAQEINALYPDVDLVVAGLDITLIVALREIRKKRRKRNEDMRIMVCSPYASRHINNTKAALCGAEVVSQERIIDSINNPLP